MESETGWWLITHSDHARLAGTFAAAWGNEIFLRPEPRERVLRGISRHDDGWTERDAHPTITRQGKPSAFSTELVGSYAAFEEIDIAEYLAVRERAVRVIAERDAYAGLLVLMHTVNLLTAHADRSTIATDGLTLLDAFLERQREQEQALLKKIAQDDELSEEERSESRIREHFRLLQACDSLSLLSCVAYDKTTNLLHPLPLSDGRTSEVHVEPLGSRHFRLTPWPFAEPELTLRFPARHVAGKTFASSAELKEAFAGAEIEDATVKLTA